MRICNGDVSHFIAENIEGKNYGCSPGLHSLLMERVKFQIRQATGSIMSSQISVLQLFLGFNAIKFSYFKNILSLLT